MLREKADNQVFSTPEQTDREKPRSFLTGALAAELGFEPRQTAPEAVVLPLHNSASRLFFDQPGMSADEWEYIKSVFVPQVKFPQNDGLIIPRTIVFEEYMEQVAEASRLESVYEIIQNDIDT